MATTDRETVKLLCKKIVSRLENEKMIEFEADSRQNVVDDVYEQVGQLIFTEEDLQLKTLESMGYRSDDVVDPEFVKSDQFRTARSMVRKTFGDDVLNGFYFQKNLREIGFAICKYLMDSSRIEDVFESDENINKKVVEIIRRFNPSQMH